MGGGIHGNKRWSDLPFEEKLLEMLDRINFSIGEVTMELKRIGDIQSANRRDKIFGD